MDHFRFSGGELCCEGLPVADIIDRVGTPAYIYSAGTVLDHLARLREAFAEADPLVCFSVKANGNLSLLRVLAQAGAGFDVVSGGELFKALLAGGKPDRIVYAGVGKTDPELAYALKEDVLMFNVESAPELAALSEVAAGLGRQARVAIRINPDVEAHTHAYITTGRKGTKFGVDPDSARDLVRSKLPSALKLRGVHAHIGSQITEPEPYARAVERVADFARDCIAAGHELTHLNMGGGFGVFYSDRAARAAQDFARVIVGPVKRTGLKLILEPGRFIVANAGALVARVLYVKESAGKRFVIVDAAMNDFVRPALYGAEHVVWPVRSQIDPRTEDPGKLPEADIVGPVCESGDFLARDRAFPEVKRGDLVVLFGAGAYGMSMSSNYNGRPRAAEVLVRDGKARLVRRRETWEDLTAPEELPEET
jgi:diaminopimelate decarboxylase